MKWFRIFFGFKNFYLQKLKRCNLLTEPETISFYFLIRFPAFLRFKNLLFSNKATNQRTFMLLAERWMLSVASVGLREGRLLICPASQSLI